MLKGATWLLVGCLLLDLCGCAQFPNSGPQMDLLLSGKPDSQMPLDVVILSPETIGGYGAQPSPNMPVAPRTPLTALRYTIKRGDTVRVTIFGFAIGTATSSTGDNGGLFKSVVDGGNVFDQLRVGADGTITLPYLNHVQAAGRTTTQLETQIATALVAAKSIDQPTVQVGILSTSAMVHVSGDVRTPGDYSLVDGPQTVLDAINKAGGPAQPALQSDVVLRRGSSVISMSMDHLLLHGGDTGLQPNDDIVVRNHPRGFIAMGALKSSGVFPFTKSDPSLLDALGQIGGLVDTQADPTGVFVFRQSRKLDSPGKPTVFVLDFSKPTALFLAKQFAVRPEDTIYVTNAPLYQAGKIITILSGTGNLLRNSSSLSNPSGS